MEEALSFARMEMNTVFILSGFRMEACKYFTHILIPCVLSWVPAS